MVSDSMKTTINLAQWWAGVKAIILIVPSLSTAVHQKVSRFNSEQHLCLITAFNSSISRRKRRNRLNTQKPGRSLPTSYQQKVMVTNYSGGSILPSSRSVAKGQIPFSPLRWWKFKVRAGPRNVRPGIYIVSHIHRITNTPLPQAIRSSAVYRPDTWAIINPDTAVKEGETEENLKFPETNYEGCFQKQ